MNHASMGARVFLWFLCARAFPARASSSHDALPAACTERTPWLGASNASRTRSVVDALSRGEPCERCAIVARQKLSALRMLPAGLTEKRKTWVERVFLEWVAVAVGARDRTGKKVQKCQNRRREFFTDGPLHSGCRIHLHRREERASLFDEETPRTPQLSKKPPFVAVLRLNARFLSASTLHASAQNAARDRGCTRLRNAAPGAPKRRACCLLQRCKAITSSR